MKLEIRLTWPKDHKTALASLAGMTRGNRLMLKRARKDDLDIRAWLEVSQELSSSQPVTFVILEHGPAKGGGWWFLVEAPADQGGQLLKRHNGDSLFVYVHHSLGSKFSCGNKPLSRETSECSSSQQQVEELGAPETLEITEGMVEAYRQDVLRITTWTNEAEAAVLAGILAEHQEVDQISFNVCEYFDDEEQEKGKHSSSQEKSTRKDEQEDKKGKGKQEKDRKGKGKRKQDTSSEDELEEEDERLLRFVHRIGDPPAYRWLLHTGDHYQVLLPNDAGPYTVIRTFSDGTVVRLGRFARSPILTRDDGSCLLDACHIAVYGARANDEQIRAYRVEIAERLSEEVIRQNLTTILQDLAQGHHVGGVGEHVRQAVQPLAEKIEGKKTKFFFTGTAYRERYGAAGHELLDLVIRRQGPLILFRKDESPLDMADVLAALTASPPKDPSLELLEGSDNQISSFGLYLLTLFCKDDCGRHGILPIHVVKDQELTPDSTACAMIRPENLARLISEPLGGTAQYASAGSVVPASPDGCIRLCRKILQGRKDIMKRSSEGPAMLPHQPEKVPEEAIYVISSNRAGWLLMNLKKRTYYGRRIGERPIIFVVGQAERDAYTEILTIKGQTPEDGVFVLYCPDGFGIGWNRYSALLHAKAWGVRTVFMLDDNVLRLYPSGGGSDIELDAGVVAKRAIASYYPGGIMQQALAFNLGFLQELNFCPFLCYSKEDLTLQTVFQTLTRQYPAMDPEASVEKFDKTQIPRDQSDGFPGRVEPMLAIAQLDVWCEFPEEDESELGEPQPLKLYKVLTEQMDSKLHARLPYEIMKAQEQVVYDCLIKYPQEMTAFLLQEGWFTDDAWK